MKNIFSNIGYFFKEVRTIIKTNLLSNVFSLFSTILIFFILSLIIAGWQMSSYMVKTIEGDARISVYYNENIDNNSALKIAERIKALDGASDVKLIDKNEAFSRMQQILGKDAQVLQYFDDNPFSPFLEVNISIDKIDPVLKSINSIEGVDYIRDNREVLNRIKSIRDVLSLLGYLILAATTISTVVIISHIIRTGIQNNNEQINTLKLLGAPNIFIAFPFLMEGLLLTLSGGILASIFGVLTIRYIYVQVSGPLPFIPLPSFGSLIPGLITIVICTSILLGVAGSIFGLLSAKKN